MSASSAPLSNSGTDLPVANPGSVGLAVQPLIDMTTWVIQNPSIRIFSLLLSQNGTLVYELYTPGIERDEAHYMMSTSKSFTSAIVGAAIDRGLIPGTDTSVADLLPPSLFGSSDDIARFGAVTLRDVMGMSALDADEPPRCNTPACVQLGTSFLAASNRVQFALTQALLPTPGTSYQYNDVTPMLAGGAVQYATQERLFDFGTQTLFAPMGFQNAEWMGEDSTGIDLAAYGLRLRPIDMQKFGTLFLNNGRWGTEQLLSASWVNTSWTAYMNTGPGVTPGYENYGWYWWHRSDWGTEVHWTNGWRGQFIVCMPAYGAVFTMTADIEDGTEVNDLATLMTQYVVPALANQNLSSSDSDALENTLAAQLAAAHEGITRVNLSGESRMIPSVAPKGAPIPFTPPIGP